ncbi:hypothetical protein BKA93DRAFT_757812 [Sparassis latifolia]
MYPSESSSTAYSIRERLLQADYRFLSAVGDGLDAIEDFEKFMLILRHDIETAIQDDNVDQDLMVMVRETFSRIAILAEEWSYLEDSRQILTSTITEELDAIASQLTLEDVYQVSDVYSPRTQSSPLSDHTDLYGEFHDAAYAWLLDNIHNPYPSRTVVRNISLEYGVTSSSVSSWFEDVRERIGWNSLCMEYFHGSRSGIVGAAARTYSRDCTTPLSHLALRFKDIRMKLLRLTEGYEDQCMGGRGNGTVDSLDALRRPEYDGDSHDTSSPSSSTYSHRLSREPSLVSWTSSDESKSEDDAMPPEYTACRKRNFDLSYHGLTIEEAGRISKRPRLQSESCEITSKASCQISDFNNARSDDRYFHNCAQNVPLVERPPSLCNDPEALTSPASSSFSFSNALPAIQGSTPTLPRKRRLSDADLEATPKRPRGLPMNPRQHAVSDPLPMCGSKSGEQTFSLDGWFESYFRVPEAVSPSDLDVSVPVDIDVFTDWNSVDGIGINDPAAVEFSRIVSLGHQIELPIDIASQDVLLTSCKSLTSSGNGTADNPEVVIDGPPSADSDKAAAEHATTGSSRNVDPSLFPSLNAEDTMAVPAISSCPMLSTTDSSARSSSTMSPKLDASTHPSQPDPNSPPPVYSSLPSFLYSSDVTQTVSSNWDPYWDSFEELSEVVSQSPPPPYQRLSSGLDVNPIQWKASDIASLFSANIASSHGSVPVEVEKRIKIEELKVPRHAS